MCFESKFTISFYSHLSDIPVQLNQVANYQFLQAWVFAHIQLTPEEVAKYKNIPVVYDGEYGFFFEPNE